MLYLKELNKNNLKVLINFEYHYIIQNDISNQKFFCGEYGSIKSYEPRQVWKEAAISSVFM